MRDECKKCHKHYRTLTEEELCYFCHYDKYGSIPTAKPFNAGDWDKPMQFKKKK